MKDLKTIFNQHGTDKAAKHRYHEVYEPDWAPLRETDIDILEVGVWQGHGLAAMQEYFTEAWLYGIDIFKRITPGEVPALKLPRVQWAEADSTSYATQATLANFGTKFDIIIDDGAHYPEANMLTFRNCSPFLKPGGTYYIEDVWPLDKMTAAELKHPWLQRWPKRYDYIKFTEFMNEIEASGFEITRHDLRKKANQPDSYIIALKKPV